MLFEKQHEKLLVTNNSKEITDVVRKSYLMLIKLDKTLSYNILVVPTITLCWRPLVKVHFVFE